MNEYEPHAWVTSTLNSYEDEVAKPEEKTTQNQSSVDHPRHYNRQGAMECIEELELIFGSEVVLHFCLCNVLKYRYRAGLKNNGYEDLEKSDWYMRKYKELKEKIEKNNTPDSITIPYKPNIDPWVITTTNFNGAKTNEN